MSDATDTIGALVEALRNARLLLKIKRDDPIALLQIEKIDAALAAHNSKGGDDANSNRGDRVGHPVAGSSARGDDGGGCLLAGLAPDVSAAHDAGPWSGLEPVRHV